MNKICPVCGNSFEPNYHTRKYCSEECYKVSLRRYDEKLRLEHPEEYKRRHRNYYYRNIDRIKKQQRKKYYKNREKYLEYSHNYYLANKERISAYKKEWYKAKKQKKLINACKLKHDNCFSCPTENGECLYD